MNSHESKLARLRVELAAGGRGGIGLAKSTSNLFRDRERQARPRVDLSGFNEVAEVDAARSRVSAEGMTTYADLVDATLAHGVMPCVVPQWPSSCLASCRPAAWLTRPRHTINSGPRSHLR